MSERFSRNEGLFGAEGQERIAATTVAIVGLGGLGSHVAQQLAYLGVRRFILVDFDYVTESSLNRLIGAYDAYVAAATLKIDAAERMIKLICPEAEVIKVARKLEDVEAAEAIARADIVFGCLDRDLPRLRLTELCAQHARPYFDLATDVLPDDDKLRYGGRVVFANGQRCLSCLRELDQRQIAYDQMNPAQRAADERIYGVRRRLLGETGPMVVSINGAVASLAVTEFICHVTGLRPALGKLVYRAEIGSVGRAKDTPIPGCYFCTGLWPAAVA